MAKFAQKKYQKFKKKIIGEGPAKCKPYPKRVVESQNEELIDDPPPVAEGNRKGLRGVLTKKIRGISMNGSLEITPRFNCWI